jgi:hypothetical protein
MVFLPFCQISFYLTMSGFLAAGCGGEGYGMEVNGAGQVIVFRREQ